VFSNEVDVHATPLTGFVPGQPANVLDHAGKALGSAYVNPASLICARLVSRRADRPLDEVLLGRRLQGAVALRERLGLGTCHRLVYGESDGLPGLIVDRHDDVLVVQIATAGMERLSDAVVERLLSLLSPRAVVLRNDAVGRELEGLNTGVSWVHGEPLRRQGIVENTVRFCIDPDQGQKTGWFYDHRLNRARLAAYARGTRVLDLFCHLGGFGIQAAVAGAREALCVDSSEAALAGVTDSARMNGVSRRVRTRRGDVFQVLKALIDDDERFDVVVVDPPAFARRRRDLKSAMEAYQRLNRMAMKLLGAEGLLLSASCSSHLDEHGFERCIRQAARGAGRQILELERGRQGPDHPVHPSMPETDYLKCRLYLVRAG
jgi:23S rRNA (cytosine1962-C5)-methyltransferase